MKRIFIALAVITVFERLSICSAIPLQNPLNSFIKGTPSDSNPNLSHLGLSGDQIAKQMENVLVNMPTIIEAISELPRAKVDEMIPHLKAIVAALDGNCLTKLFGQLLNLCANYDGLQQMRNAYQHIRNLLERGAGSGPVTIKHKTNIALVYAPGHGASRDDDDEEGNSAARQMMQQGIGQLRNEAKAAQAQLARDIQLGSDDLRNQIKEAFDAGRQELMEQLTALRTNAQKAYIDMRNGFGHMRQYLVQQLKDLNAEFENTKAAYINHVGGFKTAIQDNLSKTTEAVQQQVDRATNELNSRFDSTASKVKSQVDENSERLNDELQQAAKALDDQLREIRAKMETALGEIREEMRSVDDELKAGLKEAGKGAKAVSGNGPMPAEMKQAIEEMRSTTREMRQKMETEIQNAVQMLSKEIESIIADLQKQGTIRPVAVAGKAGAQTDEAARSAASDNAANKTNGPTSENKTKPVDEVPSSRVMAADNVQDEDELQDLDDDSLQGFDLDADFDELEP